MSFNSFTAINNNGSNTASSNSIECPSKNGSIEKSLPKNHAKQDDSISDGVGWGDERTAALAAYNAKYMKYPEPAPLSFRDRPVWLCNLHAIHVSGETTLSLQEIYKYYSDNFDRERWSTGTHQHQKFKRITWNQTVRKRLGEDNIYNEKIILHENKEDEQRTGRLFLNAGKTGLYQINPIVNIPATLSAYITWFNTEKPAVKDLDELIHEDHIPGRSAVPPTPSVFTSSGPPVVPPTPCVPPSSFALPSRWVSPAISGTLSPSTMGHSSPAIPGFLPGLSSLLNQSARESLASQQTMGGDWSGCAMNSIISRFGPGPAESPNKRRCLPYNDEPPIASSRTDTNSPFPPVQKEAYVSPFRFTMEDRKKEKEARMQVEYTRLTNGLDKRMKFMPSPIAPSAMFRIDDLRSLIDRAAVPVHPELLMAPMNLDGTDVYYTKSYGILPRLPELNSEERKETESLEAVRAGRRFEKQKRKLAEASVEFYDENVEYELPGLKRSFDTEVPRQEEEVYPQENVYDAIDDKQEPWAMRRNLQNTLQLNCPHPNNRQQRAS